MHRTLRFAALGSLALGAVACKPDEKQLAACPESQSACGEVCATLESDREHCGECGNVCGAGQLCVAGQCSASCPKPATSCAGSCVDTDTDPSHCGSCGNTCGEGEVCVNGGCNTACPAGQTACGGRCVDLANDASHCGACDEACAVGDACVAGACAACVDGAMEGAFPRVITESTKAGVSQQDVTCGYEKSANTPDLSYAITAPSAGVYEIDSEGSEVDVVLALLDASCRGRTLACIDSTETSRERSLRVVLDQGETVVVVAESKLADAGRVRLRVNQVEREAPPAEACAPTILGSDIPKTLVGDTSALTDALTASCGAAGSPEALYQFTAPATGRYEFDTFGSNFDTVLSILKDGCQGSEIACNDDAQSGSGEASQLSVKLLEGESVLLLVEGLGEAGKFTLHASASSFGDLDPCCFDSPSGGCGNPTVEECVCATDDYCCTQQWDVLCAAQAESECELSCKTPTNACEVTDLGSTVPQSVNGSTLGALDVLAPSCSTGGSPERLYRFTAPEAGSFAFDTEGSAYDTVVYVLAGACDGAELACNDQYGSSSQSRAIVTLEANEEVVVAVDGYGGEADAFTLNVFRVDGGETGDCCLPHEGGGCSVPSIETCVCEFDSYCCDSENGWDDLCVSAASAQCSVCQ